MQAHTAVGQDLDGGVPKAAPGRFEMLDNIGVATCRSATSFFVLLEGSAWLNCCKALFYRTPPFGRWRLFHCRKLPKNDRASARNSSLSVPMPALFPISGQLKMSKCYRITKSQIQSSSPKIGGGITNGFDF